MLCYLTPRFCSRPASDLCLLQSFVVLRCPVSPKGKVTPCLFWCKMPEVRLRIQKDVGLLCVCQLCHGKNGEPAPGLTGGNWVGKKGAKAAQCWQTPAGTILLSVSSRCCLTVLHFAVLSIPQVSSLRSTNGTDPRLAESPAKPLSWARDVLLERQLCCRQGKGPDPNPTEIFSRI